MDKSLRYHVFTDDPKMFYKYSHKIFSVRLRQKLLTQGKFYKESRMKKTHDSIITKIEKLSCF